MADLFAKEMRSFIMSRIHSDNTIPEVILRHSLWHLGYRYRKNDKKLPGKPDIVLPKYRTVVFVHGCFWHGHKGCKLYATPKTNTDYWVAKIARNQKRDEDVWRQLEAMGWAVVIVWECELKKSMIESTVDRVVKQIVDNGKEHERRKEERRQIRQRHFHERREQKMRLNFLYKNS